MSEQEQTIEGVDAIYTTAVEMMRWSGESTEILPIQQILLRNEHFYGYLFAGERVSVIWTAEDQAFSVSVREQAHGSDVPVAIEESALQSKPKPKRPRRKAA